MKAMVTIMLALGSVGVASAYDLGNQAPIKPIVTYPENIPNPILQGGDTIANATVIPGLPYDDSGTTVGYTDNYQSTCFYAGGAPDVVYRITIPPGTGAIGVSLCGSTYDTGLYILDAALREIACNDDYCGLQSQLDHVPVTTGQTYYIVVDGYSSASGSYVLRCTTWITCCVLSCPNTGVPEDEPPLSDGYIDTYNGGCSAPGSPFQVLRGDLDGNLDLCGESGWYLNSGSFCRDTDWYILMKSSDSASIEITADAESGTYIGELGPQDCGAVAIVQSATVGPCIEASLTIGGPSGPVWFWVAPTVFTSPDGSWSYDYIVWFRGLEPAIATERFTWSSVKSLFE
jgi:hypothetical protein